MIRIQSLHKYFNKGRQNELHVLNDISLELPERGIVAIFGKSGCGKTTLLNVIGGLDKFYSGALTVEGESIEKNTDCIRNRSIGYIFQNYNLNKAETNFDNVANALRLCGMTDKQEIEERTIAALANVGMEKYRARTPDTLSGGQQQRIAIARAIVKNPKIILADEPTGNLDEANTLMIMDLLKQIAKDHLVILVTHEANLVDYYCDTVIELDDGKIINIRNNKNANGLLARNKNDIYLGELEKSELTNGNVALEYYGDAPQAPIKIKVVQQNGKLYLRVDTPKVQILDDSSETQLRAGVFQQISDAPKEEQRIDMSKLPPFQGSRFGKLFSFHSSVKSGFAANFRHQRKGKRMLISCMALFSAVLVFITAMFGTAFYDIIHAKQSYNHNTFYVFTPDASTSQKLMAALGSEESAIDSLRISTKSPKGDETVKFITGFFETFTSTVYDESSSTNAVLLGQGLAKDLPLVAGTNNGLADWDVLISTAVADRLLEKSSLGYITGYDDLIGLITPYYSVSGKNLRIAGIVRTEESAMYLTDMGLSRYTLKNQLRYVAPAQDYGMEVKQGEVAFLLCSRMADVTYPAVGEAAQLRGQSFRITKLVEATYSYEEWLKQQGKTVLPDEYTYFTEIVQEEYPSLELHSNEFYQVLEAVLDERFFDYLDAYYIHLDEFLAEQYRLQPNNPDLWIATQANVLAAKLTYTMNCESYYIAIQHKELTGSYPSRSEAETTLSSQYTSWHQARDDAYEQYKGQLVYTENLSHVYLLSNEDYITLAQFVGDTDPLAVSNTFSSQDIAIQKEVYFVDYELPSYNTTTYTVVHSTDPQKTDAFLERTFPDLQTNLPGLSPILTPDSIYNSIIGEKMTGILTNLLTMVIMFAVLSLCMYFIMRSSLMNRIKEIGIYRAIGVSKKNLTFKFLMESLVLSALTVLPGFLACSLLMIGWQTSSMITTVFFYPPWLAAILLVLLLGVCLMCGTLPIRALLRKTPSQILSKYDI